MTRTIVTAGPREYVNNCIKGKPHAVITDLTFILEGTFCPFPAITPETKYLVIEGHTMVGSIDAMKKISKMDGIEIIRKGQEPFTINPVLLIVEEKPSLQSFQEVDDLLKTIFQDKLNHASGVRSCLEQSLSDLHRAQERCNTILHKIWPPNAPVADLLDLKNEMMQLVMRASANMQRIDKCRCA